MNLKLVDSLAQIINNLTPEEKKKLGDKIDLIAPDKTVLTPLKEEPFIGMWSDRQDLEDSSQWVKNLREREWS
ncbi:MAG: hypothetical protein SXA11_19035 [Cyanobacteriota bacterium]|nr:hypothetical protein [Cyanobacteriota bacterium]